MQLRQLQSPHNAAGHSSSEFFVILALPAHLWHGDTDMAWRHGMRFQTAITFAQQFRARAKDPGAHGWALLKILFTYMVTKASNKNTNCKTHGARFLKYWIHNLFSSVLKFVNTFQQDTESSSVARPRFSILLRNFYSISLS